MPPAQPSKDDPELESLRSAWKTLYSSTLPSLARAKDSSQQKWPVTLDHCFARIILDNTLGGTPASSESDADDPKHTSTGAKDNVIAKYETEIELVPWDTVISRPAVRNMDAKQLGAAIALGERIAGGKVDLVELDRRSLVGRGKSAGKYGAKAGAKSRSGKVVDGDQKDQQGKQDDKKRKRGANGLGPGDRDDAESARVGIQKKKQSTLAFKTSSENKQKNDESADNGDGVPTTDSSSKHTKQLERALDTKSTISKEEALAILKRIQTDKSLTPFRRNLYTSLLSVPRGQYTTYAALAKHLNSVARAVGNGMRNNPFAPDVPCHRVLASDGTIGGFGGDWGRDGKITEKQGKKMELLKEEGVRFDSAGKVKGQPWAGFWDKEDFVERFGDIE